MIRPGLFRLALAFALFIACIGMSSPALADCNTPNGVESQTRFDAGVLYFCNGTNWIRMDNVGGPSGLGCIVGDKAIPHNGSATFYSAISHSDCATISEVRTCTGGALSGSFTHATCSAPLCGGVEVGGYCWYFGATDANCTTVCTGHGGYNAATLSYAGSDGTNGNCQSVLEALNAGPPGGGVSTNGFTLGCMTNASGTARYRGTGATVEGSNGAAYRRACACNN